MSGLGKNLLQRNISFGGVSLTQKALLAKHLSIMVKSGLTASESIDISAEATTGKLTHILKNISKSVRSGRSLSEAFAVYPKIFSGIFLGALRVGESSGTLSENLENISVQLNKEKALIDKIRGAMLYPIIVLSATFVLGLLLSFVVLPKLTPLFLGLRIDLPFTTRALIWFSNFLQDYKVLILIFVTILVFFIPWLLRRDFIKPFTHYFLIKTPVVKNIVRGSNLARFSRTLGMLLKSGVNIDEALDITAVTMNNFYYSSAVGKIRRGVIKGTKLSDNLGLYKNLFPNVVIRMVAVGEESGKFEETLFYLAEFYEDEVDNATKNLSATIEPLLLLFIGLVVGFMALSIITPIYDLTGNINR